MERLIKSLLCIILVVCFYACTKTDWSKKIFEPLSERHTNIKFSNSLVENDSLNYFTYPYLYLGGGVSAGDINNDGLIDLYFTGNMVENKLYLNKGNLRFEDITISAHVTGDSRWYTGSTMADVNNDGYLDIYCSVAGKFEPKENQLFINKGDNTFIESAKEFGLAENGNSIQSTFFDYDKDGDLDVYIANYPSTSFNAPTNYYLFKMNAPKNIETDKLLRNNGDNTFSDVTKEAGLKSFGLSLSATVGDLNNDGWPDLYVSNDFSSPDFLYQNNKDGTFSNIIKKATKHTSHFGMGVDIADFNNDGFLDILQVDMDAADNRRAKANMASMNPNLFWVNVNAGFQYQYMHNTLQLNNGVINGNTPDFSNVSRLAGISSTDWSWGPLLADLDNDGFKDVFITNGTRREINNKDYLKTLEKKINNNDSLLKWNLAFPSEKIDNFVFKNNGDLTFERKNKDWGIQYKGFSNGSVYVDLDNDGDLEIVTNNIDDYASIFENKSSETNNHITLHFRGITDNHFGIGVKAYVYTDGSTQLEEMTLTRGFQSSIAPRLHFGLGKKEKIDSIRIVWPDEKIQSIIAPRINSFKEVRYNEAIALNKRENEKSNRIFSTVQDSSISILHKHVENYYDDFNKEILLPHQTSKLGPGIGIGDLNNDGTDDLVIAAAAQNTTVLFFQNKDGGFVKSDTEVFALDSGSEDIGIHIFDVENDGDKDIYISSGGNEFLPNSKQLQDRLYINDGSGNFQKEVFALPEMTTSSSRVHSFDFDKDGDLDLFVGGRLIPGNYPSPANSYLLENISKGDKIQFVDATEKLAPELKKLGMVTDGLWTDFDNDGWTDLIVVGEWMPITILKNNGGYFSNISPALGLDDTNGWWFSIKDGDFDRDGDMDYIIGNLGKNFKYKANEEETFDIYFNDFDNNNTNDIVLSYFSEGEQFPVRGRECSSQQIPAIKKKFKNYESYSQATLEDIYTEEVLENSLHYQVKSFSSIYLENKKGKFVKNKLPNLAQISSINQILIDDFDQDDNLDALIVGNLYNSEVETPRNDASNGLLLKGDGKGDFLPVLAINSGFYASGDVKDMSRIKIVDKEYIVVSKNSDYLQFIEIR
ncbi:VCBS repeat-containing protein [Flagellimonas sp. CMM7]|uniref:VCBS repeat-containing protein n=1 Tax=Flagellimonas sp. CMM7 TaxID=2654676 RepID=UPI0013D8C9CA|nr:VCBS repeat-containing protein [Flagellimonas sp. CMM7]UII80357.1 VCBS repeat-containing protein [Flagellimonas sp. CMM7]